MPTSSWASRKAVCEQRGIGGIDAAAGKRDLAAMTLDRVGAADEHQMQIIFALHDRDQHRSCARRSIVTGPIIGIGFVQRVPQLLDLLVFRENERLIRRSRAAALRCDLDMLAPLRG